MVFEALGAVDELNSRIGLAREHCPSTSLGEDFLQQLCDIQSALLDAGSSIATPLDSEKSNLNKISRVKFDCQKLSVLEAWIDRLDSAVPPLRHFILPGGGLASSHFHLARTAARTAERRASMLVLDGAADPEVLKYLNRLSDFLFAAARFAAHKLGHPETQYQKT